MVATRRNVLRWPAVLAARVSDARRYASAACSRSSIRLFAMSLPKLWYIGPSFRRPNTCDEPYGPPNPRSVPPVTNARYRRSTTACDARHTPNPLLDGDALGEVARLVDVAAAEPGDVVREELQRHGHHHRGQQLGSLRNVQHVVGQREDLLVALRGHRDHLGA